MFGGHDVSCPYNRDGKEPAGCRRYKSWPALQEMVGGWRAGRRACLTGKEPAGCRRYKRWPALQEMVGGWRAGRRAERYRDEAPGLRERAKAAIIGMRRPLPGRRR